MNASERLQWILWARDRQGLTSSEKMLLMILATHVESDGRCERGCHALSKESGLDKGTISSAGRALECKGLIQRKREPSKLTQFRLIRRRELVTGLSFTP